MNQYKVTLKFKETGSSFNETIANVLKIELENYFYNTLTKEIG